MVNESTRVEVAANFDTTGSMNPCIREVRRKVETSLTALFKEIPNIRVALGANGDYCDADNPYVTTWHDFSTDIHSLCKFVRTVKDTGGGDLPECYELVLREAQKLNWSHNSKKVLILAADDVPHSPNDRQNIEFNGKGIDWRKEADALAKMGVAVYAVQCLSKGSHATAFYRELAERTGGYHFTLDQFSEVTDLIMAICYRQAAPAQFSAWERTFVASGRVSRSMDENLARLSGRKISERFARKPKSLDAVPPGRFQMLYVEPELNHITIRDFVNDHGLIFKKGKGFYQFTKTETIQEYKEVVLRDKETGDMYSGEKARQLIGLNSGERARLKPVHLEQFDIFVQSTSYNRVLVGGTYFLYEVDLSR